MPVTPPGSIGSWTSTYLTKFLNDWLRRNPLPAQDQLTIKKLTVSDSFTYSGQPTISSSKFSDGPPPSPHDGDIWIATDVEPSLNAGAAWQFRYNATSSSPYKWEFIGGPRLSLLLTTQESGSGVSGFDLPTVGPIYTIPREGDWMFDYGAMMQQNTAGAGAIVELLSSTLGTGSVQLWQQYFPAAGEWITLNATGLRYDGLVAGSTVKLFYNCWGGGTTATFTDRHLEVTPIRIK